MCSGFVLSCSVKGSFVTLWAIAHQAHLFMEFFRQEYCSGLPFPTPVDLPNSGIEPSLTHYRQILYQLSHQGCNKTIILRLVEVLLQPQVLPSIDR